MVCISEFTISAVPLRSGEVTFENFAKVPLLRKNNFTGFSCVCLNMKLDVRARSVHAAAVAAQREVINSSTHRGAAKAPGWGVASAAQGTGPVRWCGALLRNVHP
jgi:hypothetical protein